MASAVRERVKSLFAAVEKINSSEALETEPTVPEQFLQENNIRLVRHDLTLYENWVNQTPPMFFERFIGFKHHPRYDNGISEPKGTVENVEFRQYDPDNPLMEPMGRTHYLTDYINDWAEGGQIHRKMPWGALTRAMFEFRGLEIVYEPHRLYTTHDDFLQLSGSNGGGVHPIFEFRPEVHGKLYPHLIMLGHYYKGCDEGSILRGELLFLLQAMRNRSIQPTDNIEEESDEYDTSETEDEEFQFPNEKRFPVLMISVMPPSHVRVYHACMNGSELLIRQTPTWSLEKRNDELLDFLASVLLSSPVEEAST